jgi:hypothetical protein
LLVSNEGSDLSSLVSVSFLFMKGHLSFADLVPLQNRSRSQFGTSLLTTLYTVKVLPGILCRASPAYLLMSCMQSDLLHPGFPIINTGMRVRMHTSVTNTFSRSAWFFAVPGGSVILSK